LNSLEVLYRLDSTNEISNIKEAIEQVILQTEELIRNACYSAKFGELIFKASIAMTEDERSTLIDDIAEDLSRNVDIDIKDIITKKLESAIDPEMFIEAAVLSRKMRKATVAEKLGKKTSSVCAASSNKEYMYRVIINEPNKYFAMTPSSKKAEVKGAFKNIKQSCIDSVKSEDLPYFGISISIDPDSYKKEKNNLTLIISFNNKEILDKFIKKLVEPVIKGNFKKNEANFEIKEL